MLGCTVGLLSALMISGILPGTSTTGRAIASAEQKAQLEARERTITSGTASRGTARRSAEPPAHKPRAPKPVAGLNAHQMANAGIIIAVAKKRKLSQRAMLIGVMTSLQETQLHNVANDNMPASLKIKHSGTGHDHDSVGIFQQRPSSGWGSIPELMNPSYAANAFFGKLERVSGWEKMALTVAAQSVQGSAFPDAYAKHEARARKIVAAFV